MKYSVLFIEPNTKTKLKPQIVTDFINSLVLQVEMAGGKIYVNHDVVMMGVYDATIAIIVNYQDNLLPSSNNDIKVLRKSFADESGLLNSSMVTNISVLKTKYVKSKKLFEKPST